MLRIELVITKDTATPALAALDEALKPDNLMPVFGRSVSNTVRSNFDGLEGSRQNQLGGARTHYYSQARDGTSFTTDGDEATVHIRQIGMRLHYYGGHVGSLKSDNPSPGATKKYLTIPANAEAYGHRAADFPDLKVIWGATGPIALARVEQKSIATVSAAGAKTINTDIMYWLVTDAKFEADKTVLPSSDEMTRDIKRDFSGYIKSVFDPGAADRALHRKKENEVLASFGGGM